VPHLTIEYSSNVAKHHDIDALVTAAHHQALDHGLAKLAALRTRAHGTDHYRLADGAPERAFIAIHARVGPGREHDQKRSFIEAVLKAAQHQIGETPLTIAWSIEITEIDADLRVNDNQIRASLEAAPPNGPADIEET